MSPRYRILLIIGVLFLVALVWYFVSTPRLGDLQLIGTVDANEVIVSSRIPGRIQTLSVQEGDTVRAGQLLATIEDDDLLAARRAATATFGSEDFKLRGARETERQTSGETASQVATAEAQLQAAKAALEQSQALYEHQNADTRRTIALAAAGVMSAQQRDEASTSLTAADAAVTSAKANVAVAEAGLRQSQAHAIEAKEAAQTVASTRQEMANARALENEAQVNVDYSRVLSPIDGKVDVRAARQGEVVSAGAPIVTIVDLTQTWVYAPLPETQADTVQLGDRLRVVMPSGETLSGEVIAKSAEGDFATQRDVSRRKRDIKTVQLKLLIPNPGMRFVPGMTAEVYIPESKMVKQ